MSTKQQLKSLRPALKDVAPITVWNVRGFGIFNIVFGLLLVVSGVNIPIQQVVAIDIRIWGIIFMVHGVVLLYFLLKNNWDKLKAGMVIGLFMKGAWSLQLLSLGIHGAAPYIYILLTISIFLLYIQCITFLNFTPKSSYSGRINV